MANVAGNPYIVDTGTSTVTALHVRVRSVRWIGATTAGHIAIITDTAGNVKWASEASGANYAEASPGFASLGLKVTTLSSGKLYIETD